VISRIFQQLAGVMRNTDGEVIIQPYITEKTLLIRAEHENLQKITTVLMAGQTDHHSYFQLFGCWGHENTPN